ncbi:HAD family hydrolase [Actinacidiphila rubida]|uniref:HAD family hydrolase n=1 Tax=Actinacidiphila rubida TaxID=310780 RepID=UPI002108A009|nr:HAD hydrolase-like protein [Actinacidiphila rubida]
MVWDWNGTLKDDLGDMVLAMNVTLAALGSPPVDRATYQNLHCVPIRDFYARLLKRPLSDAEWALAEQTYLQHIRTRPVQLRAGAAALLGTLSRLGYRQSLLSLSPHDVLTAETQAAGVAGLFERVDGRRGTDSGKSRALADHLAHLPHPVEPRRVVVVGDTLDDASAAHAAGAHAVLFARGLQHPDILTSSGLPVASTLPAAVRTGLALLPSATAGRPVRQQPGPQRGRAPCQ